MICNTFVFCADILRARPVRLLLSVSLLVCLCFSAAAAGGGITPEINTGYRPDLYPYAVRTESAVWYLAGADIDAMGMDAMLAGLETVLKDQETDFADAREALKGCLTEVPPVTICTDFCCRAAISDDASAYYNKTGNFIKVFHGWKQCKATLLHEYVHYLTIACARVPARPGFWAEGIAEYISRLVCVNRLSRSVNMGFSDEEVRFFRSRGAWDPQAGCVDERLLYFAFAELFRAGQLTGQTYFAVSGQTLLRTEPAGQAPRPDRLSMQEAACLTAYLIETYGGETVFSHWNTDPGRPEEYYGLSFPALYAAWAEWNTGQCRRLGLDMDTEGAEQ